MSSPERFPKTIWIRKHWNLDNNPFPSDAIARLGGSDPRENGLLFDPFVLPDKVKEAREKFVLAAAFGDIKFGYLWSIGLSSEDTRGFGYADARGFGKSSLMQYLVEQVNEDFGRSILLDCGIENKDAEAHSICAVLASFDMANARSLNAVLYEATRYACRFRRDTKHPTLAERLRQRIVSQLGSSKPEELLRASMDVAFTLRGRTLGPPVEEFLELLCGEDTTSLENYVNEVTPVRRTRNGANYLATFLLFVKASHIDHVILCCDQLEDFAASTTTKQKRRLETERFRDYILEIQPMSDMLSCVVTMHPRASLAIQEMWALADLPSYDYTREENLHRIVILEVIKTKEKASLLICDYLKHARTQKTSDDLYPFTQDAVAAILVNSDGKPRDILRKAHALVERGAEENWERIDGPNVDRVLAKFLAGEDGEAIDLQDQPTQNRSHLWK